MRKLQYVLLETTQRCNLNCLICGSDSKNVLNGNELSIDEQRGITFEMKQLGLKRIVLSGGEPTLKVGIERLIAFINSLSIEYGIITNGFFFPKPMLMEMIKRKPFAIGISIDGTPENHDRLRGKENSFRNLTETINLLQKYDMPVSVNTTVQKENIDDLPWILEFLAERKIYGWQIQLAMPFGRMKKCSNLVLSQEEFARVCVFIAKTREFFPSINICAADDFAYAKGDIIRKGNFEGCTAGLTSLGIDAVGNIKGCLSMTECPPEGNIRQESLTTIWNDEKRFSYNRCFSTAQLSEKCRNCKHNSICRGGCNSQSYSMTGKFNNSPFCFYNTIKGGKKVA